MEKYQAIFEDNGYDDLSYMGGGLMTKEDIFEIGINDPQDCTVLIDSLRLREHKFPYDEEGKPKLKELASGTMEDWLKSIGLSQYVVNFRYFIILMCACLFTACVFSCLLTILYLKEQHGDRYGPHSGYLGRRAFFNR